MQIVQSHIGKKALVAITGLFMVFFLIMHLLGNLEIYAGPEATNQYAVLLRTFPKVLWGFRIALIASVICHVWLTIVLTKASRAARPHGYAVKKTRKATLSSRTMFISGLTVLAFIAYHLAHYTFLISNPEYAYLVDHAGRHHVYNMVVMGFSEPIISIFYIVAVGLLGFHISHGISSAARTLGLSDPISYKKVQQGALAFAVLISLLFASIPISVMLGFIPLDL
jgi:succinate dehydrogenase / fumarate reductase cytochrome b subunit